MTTQRILSIVLAGVLLVPGSPVSSESPELGKLAERQGKKVVWKSPPTPQQAMLEGQDVIQKMRAETGEKSGARFKIRTEGAVRMGENSRFTFEDALFGPTGLLEKLDLGIEWGMFRFSFVHRPTATASVQPVSREVRIKVSPKLGAPGPVIQLYGTDVYIHVARRGGATTVYVAEGAAEVTGSEGTVRVEEGYWTYVLPGRPPLEPRVLDQELRPDASRPLDDWQLPGPLRLDRVRLDVPR